jgi:A/G-specific adenine glycosylase
LPWRAPPGGTPDPYWVWLSEIMLQQTTVTAVAPYFAAFVAKWPNVKSLARSPVDEIMRQWAGLGYYSRARNLHACARKVATDFGGRFPDTESALRDLPGIGSYTAAAIAAIAFGRHAIVVDGNVERIVARFFAIDTPLPAAKTAIRAKAAELTPSYRPGDYAQAMMDLGATICRPRKPACTLCPLTTNCAARASASPERFPRKSQKPERPLRVGAAFFVRRGDGMVLVRQRPPKGLLGGMMEFPGTEWSAVVGVPGDGNCGEAVVAGLDPALRALVSGADLVGPTTSDRTRQKGEMSRPPTRGPGTRKLDGTIEHIFTHFRLQLEVYAVECPRGAIAPADCRWVEDPDLDRQALPSVMRKVLKLVRESSQAGPSRNLR